MKAVRILRVAVLLSAAVGFQCVPALAGTADLLPPQGGYQTPAAVHACFAANPQHPDICLANGDHSGFINVNNVFGVSLGGGQTGEQEQFDSTFTGNLLINGSPGPNIMLTGPVTVDIFGRTGPYETGTFNTQMTQLDLSGPNPLGGTIMIRVDPGQASTGQTTITNNGDGTFHINSFFDIFTDLSLDGGATWQPQSTTPDPGSGPSTHVQLGPNGAGINEAAPEPASLVLIGAGLLLVGLKVRTGRP